MAEIIICTFFHHLQFVRILLILFVCFFILETTAQNARLGQSLAEVEEFPYVVSLWSWSNAVSLQTCTGVLLSLNHVLIPNTCVSPDYRLLEIHAGSIFGLDTYPQEYTKQHQIFYANDVKKHVFQVGNLAILELPNVFIEGRAVTTISIADEIQPNPNDPRYYIVGYPFSYPLMDDAHNDPKAILMKTSINVNNRSYCGEHLEMYTELELCTGVITGGLGACNTFGAILIRKASSPQANDELHGILHNDCCGVPRCFDTFYDLTNPTIKEWVEGILTSVSEPTTTEDTTTTDSDSGKCEFNTKRKFVEKKCSFGARLFTYLLKNLAQSVSPYFTNMSYNIIKYK